MKSLIEQLSTYKSVHLNAANVKTHFVGIPLIIWSLAVVLSMIVFELNTDNIKMDISLMIIVAFVVFIYYVILSRILAVMAIVIFGPILYTATWIPSTDWPWIIALVAFVAGWILQLMGHRYEKAKPAFLDDINQLFIGPLFLLAEIYFKLDSKTTLEQQVAQLAVKKRSAFEKERQLSK